MLGQRAAARARSRHMRPECNPRTCAYDAGRRYFRARRHMNAVTSQVMMAHHVTYTRAARCPTRTGGRHVEPPICPTDLSRNASSHHRMSRECEAASQLRCHPRMPVRVMTPNKPFDRLKLKSAASRRRSAACRAEARGQRPAYARWASVIVRPRFHFVQATPDTLR